MSHLNSSILVFSNNFCLIKNALSGNTAAAKFRLSKKSPKLTIFGNFNELLSTQNVNVARFARNVECDFFGDFQTLCPRIISATSEAAEQFIILVIKIPSM